MGGEPVEHPHDPLRLRVVRVAQLLGTPREVEPGPLVADADVAPAEEWFGDQEQVDHAVPDILRVAARRPNRGGRRAGGRATPIR